MSFDLIALMPLERNRLPRPLGEDFGEVFHRPIETTPFLGTWTEKPAMQKLWVETGNSR